MPKASRADRGGGVQPAEPLATEVVTRNMETAEASA
jgi:hypothetical protein